MVKELGHVAKKEKENRLSKQSRTREKGRSFRYLVEGTNTWEWRQGSRESSNAKDERLHRKKDGEE